MVHASGATLYVALRTTNVITGLAYWHGVGISFCGTIGESLEPMEKKAIPFVRKYFAEEEQFHQHFLSSVSFSRLKPFPLGLHLSQNEKWEDWDVPAGHHTVNALIPFRSGPQYVAALNILGVKSVNLSTIQYML